MPRFHPSGDGTYLLGAMLTGTRAPQELAACGPDMLVHRVTHWERHDNGVIDWHGACGASGYTTSRLGGPHHATREMLCPREECYSAVSRAVKVRKLRTPVDTQKLAA